MIDGLPDQPPPLLSLSLTVFFSLFFVVFFFFQEENDFGLDHCMALPVTEIEQ